MEGFPTVHNKHQLFLLPTSVFPTTSLALGYWDLRATSSLRVVGWIHITRSPLKHICFCCFLLWVCRREFRQSSAPTSSQESLLTCCPCLCHAGLPLSQVTDRGLGYPHCGWQFAIPHPSAGCDGSLSHPDKSPPFLLLPGASCCHTSLARSVPASSIWPRLWHMPMAPVASMGFPFSSQTKNVSL